MIEDLLGRTVSLVVRSVDAGATWLSLPEDLAAEDRIPLPAGELSTPAAVGETLDVFVYLDSEDRPIATTRTPKIALGEVAVLMVVDVAPFGAFVSWGLKKDLLVPMREQTRPVRVGEKCAVGLYLDDTDRLAGTMRVAELLGPWRAAGEAANDEWVDGIAWREEPGLGLFVILEKRTLALLPYTEPHALRIGDAARFRVTHVHPDRKVEVSLRRLKHEELDDDADRLLAVIVAPGSPKLGDGSSPEEIRAALGISKKAFKRAAGRLLKTGRASIDAAGFLTPTKET